MKNTVYLLAAICCISTSLKAQIQANGSYLNISRPSGGGVSPGNTLEIRAVFSVPAGTTVTSVRFQEAIPAGTSFISGSIKALTNEGVSSITNTGIYTDATGDDRGSISGSTVTINLGDGATSAAGGTINGTTSLPRFYNVACIIVAAYRVTVTAAIGSTITIAGTFTYNNGSPQTINLASNNIAVVPQLGCNGTDAVNFVTGETNGTFSSGTTHNRGASANVTGFTFVNLASGDPQDGLYSITKNTSPTQFTGAPALPSADRVFNLWDVFGDHTGTATAAGNAPPANGVNGGYMLVVNASYTPGIVFTTNVTGLSTNTTYTFSFWIRNICPQCGADPSTGGASGTPGVKPNLAFEINGNDYYSTGEIDYGGQWVQRSFTFNSGALTSATINIKNNAPGGGGNDWAIDDIAINTCLIVLPVKIVSFSAYINNSNVELQWEAEKETRIEQYIIESSTDGKNFSETGKVKPAGNKTYRFTDPIVISGVKYYRLKIAELNGSFIYSKVLKVVNSSSILKLSVYPNPSAGRVNINVLSGETAVAMLKVTAINGTLMGQKSFQLMKGVNVIDAEFINKLKGGIYLLKLIKSGETLYSKLVIQ